MEQISEKSKVEAIESFQSTIRKMEKALIQMRNKEANTTLVTRRLESMKIGLVALECAWYGKPQLFTEEENIKAVEVLRALMPSLERAYLKSGENSAQRTLLYRRTDSIAHSIRIIEEQILGPDKDRHVEKEKD